MLEIVEYTDPGCSWAWGTEPKLRFLQRALGERVAWRRVFGILFDAAPDRARRHHPSVDGSDDRALALERYLPMLERVTSHTGAPRPVQLSWMSRSSWPQSRAAHAARLQGAVVADRVVRRLREAVFVNGRPADTDDLVDEALAGVAGLDLERLRRDAQSVEVNEATLRDWDENRRPADAVIGLTEPLPHPAGALADGDRLRYTFPTLLFRHDDAIAIVPGWRPLSAYIEAVERVAPDLVLDEPWFDDTDEALQHYATLTPAEATLLAHDARPPRSAVTVPTANGPIWMSAAEAEHHPASRLARAS